MYIITSTNSRVINETLCDPLSSLALSSQSYITHPLDLGLHSFVIHTTILGPVGRARALSVNSLSMFRIHAKRGHNKYPQFKVAIMNTTRNQRHVMILGQARLRHASRLFIQHCVILKSQMLEMKRHFQVSHIEIGAQELRLSHLSCLFTLLFCL